MYSDSGVVTNMCGASLPMRWRSAAGVSPVRTAVRIGASAMPCASRQFRHARQRDVQILVDVVTQRLERRDVEDLRLVRQFADAGLAHQRVDGRQKRRQRLAGARGR